MKKVIICVMLILSVCLCSCQDNSANLDSEDDRIAETYSSEAEQNTEDTQKGEDSMFSSIEQNLYVSQGYSGSLGRFSILKLNDWYYYSFCNSSQSGLVSYIRKFPVDGNADDCIEIFSPSSSMVDMFSDSISTDYSNTSSTRYFEDIMEINWLQVNESSVYWASDRAIWSAPISGGEVKLIVEISDSQCQSTGAFFLNGEWIYHSDNQLSYQLDSKTKVYKHQLCRTSLDGQKTEVLYDSGETTWDKELSIYTAYPDGRVYFSVDDMLYLYYGGDVTALEISLSTVFVGSDSSIYCYELTDDGNGNGQVLTYKCLSDDLSEVELIYETSFSNLEARYGGFILYGYLKPCNIYEDTLYLMSQLSGTSDYMFNQTSKQLHVDFSNAQDFQFNGDWHMWGDDFATPLDGYLYYLIDDSTLCRVKSNGSDWKDISWMLD